MHRVWEGKMIDILTQDSLFMTVIFLDSQKFQKIWKVKEHMAEVHKIVEATDDGCEIKTLYV